jgi:CubicO group peptidase (beta-lactamase class C family)
LDDLTNRKPTLATGYVRHALGDLQPAPEEGRGWSFGAGEVVTTASDLARWDEGLLSGRLLAPRQAQEEIAAPKLADGSQSPYALGLFVAKQGGRNVLYHVGQGLGFLAVNRIYPEERTAIVVLTNDSSSLAFAHIASRLAAKTRPMI